MKYAKFFFAAALLALSICRYFIWHAYFWVIYSLIYLGLCIFQVWRAPRLRPQIISFLYVVIALTVLVASAIAQGIPKLDFTFKIILIVLLGLTGIWETVLLILGIKNGIEEKRRNAKPFGQRHEEEH